MRVIITICINSAISYCVIADICVFPNGNLKRIAIGLNNMAGTRAARYFAIQIQRRIVLLHIKYIAVFEILDLRTILHCKLAVFENGECITRCRKRLIIHQRCTCQGAFCSLTQMHYIAAIFLPHVLVAFNVANRAANCYCATVCINDTADHITDFRAVLHYKFRALQPHSTSRPVFILMRRCAFHAVRYNLISNTRVILHGDMRVHRAINRRHTAVIFQFRTFA